MTKDLHTAFMEQFAASQHRVYGYIVTLLPSRDDADDAFQETCIVLWKKWNQWTPECEFVSWACAVAHNVVRNFRRSRRRASKSILLADDVLEEIAAVRLESAPLLEARGQALSSCLEKLPETQRVLIERCYLSGEGLGAVAAAMSITPDALYLRLYRIRRALLDCIGRVLRQERTV